MSGCKCNGDCYQFERPKKENDMTTDIQFSMFSHCRCSNCNHMARIESFELIKKKLGESSNVEAFQHIYKCPLCGSEFTEALFPNEVN